MRKFFLIACIFLLTYTGKSVAQDLYRNELGFFAGISYYVGDLNPNKHFFQNKFAGGLVYRYNITPRWSFRVNALYGGLESSDAKSGANIDRNLSFRSYIFEVSPMIEFNFLPYLLGDKKRFISPYIFVGFSVFNFNPKAQYQSSWYELHDLGTEGQNTTIKGAAKPYSLTSIGIPFGLGLKITPAKFMSLGIEWGIRKNFTDYIDDVSRSYVDPVVLAAENTAMAAILADRSLTNQGKNDGLARGNSNTKDWYVFAGLTATFRIKGKSVKCAAYRQPHKAVRLKYHD